MTEEKERVFFPMGMIPVHDIQNTLALFKWAEKMGIEIVHIAITRAQIQSRLISPVGRKNPVADVQLFYGACDDEDHYLDVFAMPYEFDSAQSTPLIILDLIEKENGGKRL